MLIELKKLFSKEDNRIEEDLELPWDTFESQLGSFAIKKKTPLHIVLLHVSKRRLEVSGEVTLVIEIPCDRCLSSVEKSFTISFEKQVDCGDIDVDDDSNDTQYIVDMALDVGKIVKDELLVSWPAKVLCKDDCKGICKVCGHDLNVSDCGCDRVVLDPRMAAIQDIFRNANQ